MKGRRSNKFYDRRNGFNCVDGTDLVRQWHHLQLRGATITGFRFRDGHRHIFGHDIVLDFFEQAADDFQWHRYPIG